MKGGGFFDDNAWQPFQVKQIVTGSDYPITARADDALNQVTNYIADLQNTIRELHGRLDDAYTKIEGQSKFIKILQRQISIAEKYIINDNGRDTRVD